LGGFFLCDVYCGDFRCSHWKGLDAAQWVDNARLSDIEDRFTCTASVMAAGMMSGQIGKDVPY
jgi:hypothetical protein